MSNILYINIIKICSENFIREYIILEVFDNIIEGIELPTGIYLID